MSSAALKVPEANDIKSLKGKVSAEEWAIREDLAATYRLVALHGWDDLIFTHISARVPGPEHHFLINPYGLMFEEITASSLVKIDVEGNKLVDSPFPVNAAGFTIHSALHMNRDDAGCVIHLHTTDGVAVSAQREGLLAIDQHAMSISNDIAYHDYEGIALDLSERDRLVDDIGDKHLMILRNHGTRSRSARPAPTHSCACSSLSGLAQCRYGRWQAGQRRTGRTRVCRKRPHRRAAERSTEPWARWHGRRFAANAIASIRVTRTRAVRFACSTNVLASARRSNFDMGLQQ